MSKPVAIVTGAGRGIGRATAVELSRRGWRVALVSRTAEELAETAGACDGETMTRLGDATNTAVIKAVVRETVKAFGRLDGVVAAVGRAPMLPFEETDRRVFEVAVKYNLASAFHLARDAWPHLKKRGGGIVFVGSMASLDPFVGFSAYAAAKSALVGLTVALAKEGAEHDVRVHCVAPAGVETSMFRGLPGTADVPTGSLLAPADVAATIADCLTGSLRHASGETIYLRKQR